MTDNEMADADERARMQDEIERLRDKLAEAEVYRTINIGAIQRRRDDIERLRGLLANSEMTVNEVIAANERLRAALREIANMRYDNATAAGIARDALERK